MPIKIPDALPAASILTAENVFVMTETRAVVSNYMIMSHEDGIFKELKFDPEFEKNNLLDVYCTHKKGDKVTAYKNTTDSMGTILFKADTVEQMTEITSDIDKYYHVEVE